MTFSIKVKEKCLGKDAGGHFSFLSFLSILFLSSMSSAVTTTSALLNAELTCFSFHCTVDPVLTYI